MKKINWKLMWMQMFLFYRKKINMNHLLRRRYGEEGRSLVGMELFRVSKIFIAR